MEISSSKLMKGCPSSSHIQKGKPKRRHQSTGKRLGIRTSSTSCHFPQLVLEIIQARNLQHFAYSWEQAIDPFCVIYFENERKMTRTIPCETSPIWNAKFQYSFRNPIDPKQQFRIEVFNDQSTFFNMFPVDPPVKSTPNLALTDAIGFVTVPISMFCDPIQPVRDMWWTLQGVESGEIRLRSYFVQDPIHPPLEAACAEEYLWKTIRKMDAYDQYGFPIPSEYRVEWYHLQSYCLQREKRQVEQWEKFIKLEGVVDLRNVKHKDVVKQLIRGGIPRHLREKVYLSMTGAEAKKNKFPPLYYANLVEKSKNLEESEFSEEQIEEFQLVFRQIELDLARTFGHSNTRVRTEEGQDTLRRVLRAYALRNTLVGYCQGLNFIVGLFLLVFEEDSAFWLLAVICEDRYPGYYTRTMVDTQTDMLVLKDLVAQRLPALGAHTEDVGVPLELVGSQWLLCLFATTFPADTVWRILDCMFFEGDAFLFSVIIAHLRQQQAHILEMNDFQSVITHLKEVEAQMFDADLLIQIASAEMGGITPEKLRTLRQEHVRTVTDEMQRADRLRTLHRQVAVVQQIPAFSSYAVELVRFFHKEAEGTRRSDVAFFLTLLCHSIVWFAEHSRRSHD